jgi:hypothetical protein
MQQAHTLITWIAAGLLLTPATLVANPPVCVALNQIVVTHHESITISDLLPPNASEEIRARAVALALGEAPLPGGHRTFARAQIERALRGAPDLRNAFTIPSSVEVTRWSRLLTREEVLVAIIEALRSNQLPVPAPLLSRDLIFSTNVVVTEETPRLRVTRIEPSPDGAGTHVRLRTSSEPRTPSFWVTFPQSLDVSAFAEVPEQLPVLATRRDIQGGPKRQPTPRRDVQSLAQSGPLDLHGSGHIHDSAPRSPRLVRPGQRVELIVQSQGMRLSVNATSLEIGSLGQKVRVRNSDTGKVLAGTVVAAQTIEAEF